MEIITTFKEYQACALVTLAKKDRLPLNQLHAAIGVATEIGELLDGFKKAIFYNTDVNHLSGQYVDIQNIKEEVGDVLWYIAVGAWYWGEQPQPMPSAGRTFTTENPELNPPIHTFKMFEEIQPEIKPNTPLAIGKLVALSEASNKYLSDAFLAESCDFPMELQYGINEKLGVILHLLQEFALYMGISLEEAANTNIKKLAKRYESKGGVFSEAAAKNRNLIEERRILEGRE